MKKLSKKETIDLEKLEADKAEAYARKQRRQYRNRFGRFVPALVGITKYVVVARVLLAIFGGGYILGQNTKKCDKCSITVYPCELPRTGS